MSDDYIGQKLALTNLHWLSHYPNLDLSLSLSLSLICLMITLGKLCDCYPNLNLSFSNIYMCVCVCVCIYIYVCVCVSDGYIGEKLAVTNCHWLCVYVFLTYMYSETFQNRWFLNVGSS